MKNRTVKKSGIKRKLMLIFLSALMILLTMTPALTVSAASNEEIIYSFLTEEMGLNTAAACGVLANIEKESGFRPDATEYGYTWETGAGYGICQWTNYPRTSPTGRRTNLVNWCTSNGYDYRSLDGQLHFLQYELNTPYYYDRVTVKMQSAANDSNGAYLAGSCFCYYYLMPGRDRDAVASARGALARDVYWEKYGAETPEVSPLIRRLANILNVFDSMSAIPVLAPFAKIGKAGLEQLIALLSRFA